MTIRTITREEYDRKKGMDYAGPATDCVKPWPAPYWMLAMGAHGTTMVPVEVVG